MVGVGRMSHSSSISVSQGMKSCRVPGSGPEGVRAAPRLELVSSGSPERRHEDSVSVMVQSCLRVAKGAAGTGPRRKCAELRFFPSSPSQHCPRQIVNITLRRRGYRVKRLAADGRETVWNRRTKPATIRLRRLVPGGQGSGARRQTVRGAGASTLRQAGPSMLGTAIDVTLQDVNAAGFPAALAR